MDDAGWGWIYRGIVWVMMRCAMLIGWSIQKLYLFIFRVMAGSPGDSAPVQTTQEQDSRRVAECENIAREYITYFGYIARECFTRDEIVGKIRSGITPDALSQEIRSRMQEHPGIILGTYAGTAAEVKLPLSYRQRHVYIVGRSGSGKTNIIKTCSGRI
jgi:ABC-type glutathione transport system ATPase component